MLKTSDLIKAIEDGKIVKHRNGQEFDNVCALISTWTRSISGNPERFTIIQPKKTVKYEAWDDGRGELRHIDNNSDIIVKCHGWKRISSADIEIEI